jgi:iron complex transport system ATP-binding protein
MRADSQPVNEVNEAQGTGAPALFAELRNVNVARGDNLVLHEINLTIRAREHLAILGPNGCGKSTLIKTLTCECYPIVQPDSRIRIFGRERWDVQELRKRLGVVAAELPGASTGHTSGQDAVVSGFFSSSTLWPNLHVTDAMRMRALEALEVMEAQYLSDKRVEEMSAGEMRRVMIARALVHRPEMLLLDEPMNALDLRAQKDLRETLRRVAQAGTGLLLVTHHLPDILPEIDRVVAMRDGRVVGDGAKETMLTSSYLTGLFGIDIEIRERQGYFHASA